MKNGAFSGQKIKKMKEQFQEEKAKEVSFDCHGQEKIRQVEDKRHMVTSIYSFCLGVAISIYVLKVAV